MLMICVGVLHTHVVAVYGRHAHFTQLGRFTTTHTLSLYVPNQLLSLVFVLLTCRALTCGDIFKFIAAVFLPPLGVFLELGCGRDLVINILLTILGFIPGVIHAFYIICAH
eukprot:TRINITY_DN458_c0_g1_i3.p2 TRINITY_DN458_c0_g1~~TRINITY_DN458_c0_g1_i3.p2  ORF type:complete len:111 (-),score=8.55 TRINITY_DN458_c0_g1_i3:397-729(-)